MNMSAGHTKAPKRGTRSPVTARGPQPVPRIVRDVLTAEGDPLTAETLAPLRPAFDTDLSMVRVHTGDRAAESARSLGALAYTWGNHVVLGESVARAPATSRTSVLAHELTHVAQHRDAGRWPPARVDTRRENESIAEHVAGGSGYARVPAVSGPGVSLLRDTRLDRLLAALPDVARNAPTPLSDAGLVDVVVRHFHGVNLTDPDNLGPVSAAVAKNFPEQTLLQFLQRVETDPGLGESAQEEQDMQDRIGRLQVQRRGVWGTRTPFPVTEIIGGNAARVAQRVSAVQSAFLDGIVDGMGGPGTDALVQQLAGRLRASAVLNIAAPEVFAAGAVVGIGQDLWHSIRGLWDLITGFPEMLEKFRRLFEMLSSPAAPGLSLVMGRHIGQEWRAQLVRMAGYNVFRFTFELGRIVGPTIVYAVLAVLGITAEAVISAAAARLAGLLRRFPQILRLLERISEHLPRRRRSPFANLTEAEIDAALQGTHAPRTTGGGSARRIGGHAVPANRRPRLDIGTVPLRAGETAQAALARIRQVVGRRIADIPALRAAWDRARARVLTGRTLTAANYEELYNLTRNNFWREVRADPVARASITNAGFDFRGGATTAPVLGGVNPAIPVTETRVSLDHIAEKAIGNNWQLALDADNLRMEFAMPNTYREIIQSRHPELR